MHPYISFIYKKKLQACKPDSVFRWCGLLSFICDSCYQPPVSAYPGPCYAYRIIENEQPSTGPVHGISACKVYPSGRLPYPERELLPPVFTLIAQKRYGYFLWHYLITRCKRMSPAVSGMHCSMLSGLSLWHQSTTR